ncbi:class I tRNA ligase family protein [Streptomyces thinghirensis]|nr:class I tRNA ligase family protein [Streptomyces thinghirensis]
MPAGRVRQDRHARSGGHRRLVRLGSMPFAQWGYPHKNKELFESRYPAQFICEAIDQTRGWFYTLMAVGTLVFDKSSYENVVCLGYILAEDGRKMSSTWATPWTRSRSWTGTARTRSAGSWRPAAPRGRPGGSVTAPSRRSSARRSSPTGTRSPSRPCTPAPRVVPERGRPGARRPPGPGPLAALRAACAHRPGHAGPGRLRHPARRQAAVRLSTTCPTGTYAAPAAASGRATRRHCARCTRSSRRSPSSWPR